MSDVLTVEMIKQAVNTLKTDYTPPNNYIIPIHPRMAHWIKYNGGWGSTNSIKKFRHRNYEKAWKKWRDTFGRGLTKSKS
jgi:hypothetical protein